MDEDPQPLAQLVRDIYGYVGESVSSSVPNVAKKENYMHKVII